MILTAVVGSARFEFFSFGFKLGRIGLGLD